ncbi:MAG: hypothetical protein NVS9B15_19590 [Acidobacteriaceae bacterium]
MARNIKRNVLKKTDSELAGIATESVGRYWREPLEDPDAWLEQGKRWNVKSTTTSASAISEWASSIKNKVAGTDDGRSQTKSEYDDEGTWQHQDRDDRSKDFRAGTSGDGPSAGLSVLIGLAGGLAATFVMTQAQNAWAQAQKSGESQRYKSKAQAQSEVDEQSTVKVAQHAAHAVNADIPQEQRQTAGTAVHYGFGTLMGGVYGALSSALDDAPFGTGILFGVGLWLAADEFVLPYLGLSKPPQERDLKEHAYEASMHAVYGLCLDAFIQLRKRVA